MHLFDAHAGDLILHAFWKTRQKNLELEGHNFASPCILKKEKT
jgi:hypothetical protein